MSSLTDGEQQLLALIRDGRVDAEIAVRLGLNVGDVRDRITDLATKLGVSGKEGLRSSIGRIETNSGEFPAPFGLRPGLPRRLVFALLTVTGILLFTLGVWLGRGSGGEGGSQVVTPAAVVPQLAPTLEPPPTRTIGGVDYADLGSILDVPGHRFPAVVVDQRESLAVVTLPGPGIVRLGGPHLRMVLNGSMRYAEWTARSPRVAIFIYAADSNTQTIPTDDGFAVFARGDAAPKLLIWATETRGPFQDTRGLETFRATVGPWGELLVSLGPIPRTLAIDYSTGESLDLSKAIKVGQLPASLGVTGCSSGHTCEVGWSGGGLPAPFDGVASCSDRGALVFDARSDGVRLTFHGYNGSPDPPCPPSPQAIREGELLVIGYYSVVATDLSGQPTSLAVAGDGGLYAGTFGPNGGCPCRGGN